MNGFTFIVLTYNHQNYILEHLESIKYQIVNFGGDTKFELIVADDHSKDLTIPLVHFWFEQNKDLFHSYHISSSEINVGTCKNLTQALKHVSMNICKITAGDDVYSYENAVEEFSKIKNFDILSGFPLFLFDEKLSSSKSNTFHMIATNVIYSKKPHLERMKGINVFNAPSIIYSLEAITNPDLLKFLNQFQVTEDYPIQIKMALDKKNLKYNQTNKILVYYRRTTNSTYIIKNLTFDNDKKKIFQTLEENESKALKKILIKNRTFCHSLNAPILRRILNINLLIYFSKIIFNIPAIISNYRNIQVNIPLHQKHYNYIRTNAQMAYKSFKNLE